jgi:hypothetical protein
VHGTISGACHHGVAIAQHFHEAHAPVVLPEHTLGAFGVSRIPHQHSTPASTRNDEALRGGQKGEIEDGAVALGLALGEDGCGCVSGVLQPAVARDSANLHIENVHVAAGARGGRKLVPIAWIPVRAVN